MSILPNRFSIKLHIVGHFSLSLVIVLVLFGVAIYSFVYENLRRNMMEELSVSTTSFKEFVENAANLSVRNHLQTIARVNIDILNGLEQKVRKGQLSRADAMKKGKETLLQQRVGDNGYVYVLSSKGIVLVHPDTEMINRDISKFRFAQQQLISKNGYLEYDWKNPGEEKARSKALHMVYFEPWDWIVSVSSYRQELNFFTDLLRAGLKEHQFAKAGYAFIVNSQGDVILHPWLQGNIHAMGDVSTKSLFNRIISMKNGELSYYEDGHETTVSKRKVVFFNYISGLDWIVASTVAEDEIFQPLMEISKIISLIVLCALLLTVPVSLFLGKSITAGPLSRLVQKMHIATGGDLSGGAEENVLGGIGLFGEPFNHDIEQLRGTNQKVLSEIRGRIQAEQQLIIFQKAFEYAFEGISITDVAGNILAVNRAFSEITGYQPEEVIGHNPRILKSEKHDHSFYSQLWITLLETGRWTGEVWNRRKSGEIYLQRLSISTIYDENMGVNHYVAVFRDITERKQQEAQIKHQAYHDALTGLPNRALANDRIAVSIAHAKRGGTKLAVLFLDLDNFKNVNDSLGHHCGDKLLRQVANRLVSTVREEDTVARLGGDEFLILVGAVTSHEGVIELAQRLLNSLAASFEVEGSELFITVSIGLAFYPQDGDTADALIENADIAMYEAKAMGRNNYSIFTPDLTDRIFLLQQLENNLRQAVMNREFTIFFQPKVDPLRGMITGAEALVRWQKPDGTIIDPADFIPLAEETELIIPLGEQVLEESCRTIRMLNNLGYSNFSIAVNLSPLQFCQGNLVERILEILQKYEVPCTQLELEITETTIMTNLAESVDKLNQLVSAGISISIDDFGTGYSSLYYLKRFPVKTLKIDRSFIKNITNDPGDAQVVETIILMARNLGISTVAEGVETKAQLDWLAGCGCELIQGYYYSKPLPVEAFFAYLKKEGEHLGAKSG